jgi:hypothetical protein
MPQLLQPNIKRTSRFNPELINACKFAALGIFRPKNYFIYSWLNSQRIPEYIGIEVVNPGLRTVIMNLVNASNAF